MKWRKITTNPSYIVKPINDASVESDGRLEGPDNYGVRFIGFFGIYFLFAFMFTEFRVGNGQEALGSAWGFFTGIAFLGGIWAILDARRQAPRLAPKIDSAQNPTIPFRILWFLSGWTALLTLDPDTGSSSERVFEQAQDHSMEREDLLRLCSSLLQGS